MPPRQVEGLGFIVGGGGFAQRRLAAARLAIQGSMARLKQTFGYRPTLLWNEGVYEYLSNAYGHEHFSKVCEALARPSIYSCIRVNALQATANEVISELNKHLDRGHHEDENKGRSDNGASSSCRESSVCYEHPLLKNVVIVQGEGPCEVCYDNDTAQKIVMVSRKCAESVLRGAEVFVPGVLACSEHVDEGDVVAVFARIEVRDGSGKWSNGITRGTTLPLENARSYLGDRPDDWFIGKGRALMSRATLFREKHGIAVEMIDRIYRLPAFHGLLQGKIFLQNLPSIVTALVLDPKPGERILDMCAAPGGKTTAIATLMENTGEVIALDRSHNKVLDILSLANELQLSCIHAYKLDALKSVRTDVPSTESAVAHMDNLEKEVHSFMASLADTQQSETTSTTTGTYTSKAQERKEARRMRNGRGRGQNLGGRVAAAIGFPPGSFDRVLLDAPCSALGLRPRLFAAEETLDSLRGHASYQRRMFDRAVQLVRPGGTIVYSTCTINPGENEALVRYALDNYKCLSLVPQEPRIGGSGLVGGTNVFDGFSYREWLKEGEQDLVQRFDPSSSTDTMGFFIAKFHVSKG